MREVLWEEFRRIVCTASTNGGFFIAFAPIFYQKMILITLYIEAR